MKWYHCVLIQLEWDHIQFSTQSEQIIRWRTNNQHRETQLTCVQRGELWGLHVAWFKWFWVSVSNSRSGWVLQGLYTIIALIYLLYHNTICIVAVLFVFWDAERNKQLLWSSACRTNEYNPQIYIFKVSVGVVSAKNKTQHNKQTEEENKITFIHTRPKTWKYCMRHEKQNKRKQNTLFCFASFYQTPHTPIVNRYIESMPYK